MTEAALPISTPRLFLRPLVPTDAEAVYQLYADWEVAKQLSRIPFPFTHAAAHEFVSEAQKGLASKSTYMLAIVERTTMVVVGIIALRVPSLDLSDPEEWRQENDGLGILGYSIHRLAWGQGYATESAKAMIHFAFDTLGLTQVQATALRDNGASRRVLERLGFTIEEKDILEEPMYGGPARLADCYMLRRAGPS